MKTHTRFFESIDDTIVLHPYLGQELDFGDITLYVINTKKIREALSQPCHHNYRNLFREILELQPPPPRRFEQIEEQKNLSLNPLGYGAPDCDDMLSALWSRSYHPDSDDPEFYAYKEKDVSSDLVLRLLRKKQRYRTLRSLVAASHEMCTRTYYGHYLNNLDKFNVVTGVSVNGQAFEYYEEL